MRRWTIDVRYIDDWLHKLDVPSHRQVVAALELRTRRGPALGRPYVDSIHGSKHSNMKELRPGSSGRSELRVLFAFDVERRAILLVAGDKQGEWESWYRRHIPIADQRFDEHLRDTANGG